jgi:hypothetical protein
MTRECVTFLCFSPQGHIHQFGPEYCEGRAINPSAFKKLHVLSGESRSNTNGCNAYSRVIMRLGAFVLITLRSTEQVVDDSDSVKGRAAFFE